MINSKQKVEASNRRLIKLGGEYARSKDDAICRQKLNIMFRELSAQSLDKCAWNAYTKRIKGAGTGVNC